MKKALQQNDNEERQQLRLIWGTFINEVCLGKQVGQVCRTNEAERPTQEINFWHNNIRGHTRFKNCCPAQQTTTTGITKFNLKVLLF